MRKITKATSMILMAGVLTTSFAGCSGGTSSEGGYIVFQCSGCF